MSAYQHILVAVDLSAEARQVFARGADLAERYGARITLVHVVEPVIVDAGYDFMPALPEGVEEELLQRARRFLADLAAGHPRVECRVELGSIKGELLRLAREETADLIVLGTHGRHGVGLLLGSTANAVLHGTPCDVLSVRVGQAGS